MSTKDRKQVLGDPMDVRPDQRAKGLESKSESSIPTHAQDSAADLQKTELEPGKAAAEIINGRESHQQDMGVQLKPSKLEVDSEQGGRPGMRANDTGLGQPEFEPDHTEKSTMRRVSGEEINKIRQDQDELAREFEKKLQELEKSGIKVPASIYNFLLWSMAFIGALLGLIIVSQAVRFAGEVSALVFPLNIAALALFVFFLTIILMVVVKLGGRFLRFRKMTRIDLKSLNRLAERKRFQHLAAAKKDEAREVLLGYLADFNLKKDGQILPGLKKHEFEKLVLVRQSLLDKKGYVDSWAWLREFDESLVHILDSAARRRIRAYSRTVAMGTAASPIRIIDQLIVLYSSLKLIGELLQIYNLRPGMGQSSIILSRAIIQAYLSGVIGEQAEAGVETFSDYYENIFGEVSFATGVSAVGDASRFILPKVSEGALNGFLIWRLGTQARKMVRPL